MNNREVAHLWNAQSRQKASGSHFYFAGPTIYSYGPHFPIATIHTRGAQSLVLFTSHDYSITTSKHKSYALWACRNRHVIVVQHIEPRCHGNHAANLKTLAERQADALKHAQRRTTVYGAQADKDAAMRAWGDYSRYCLFFGIRRKHLDLLQEEFDAAIARAQRIENPDPKSADKRERARAQRIERNRERDERNRERDEYMAAHRANLQRGEFYRDMARRTDWRLFGAFDACGGNYWLPGNVMLRVVDDEIVTSQGARVPLTAAPMVWRYVQAVRNRGADWKSAESGRLRIGDYPLDRIDADGTLHAGCHVIPYSELSAMARRLGLS